MSIGANWADDELFVGYAFYVNLAYLALVSIFLKGIRVLRFLCLFF